MACGVVVMLVHLWGGCFAAGIEPDLLTGQSCAVRCAGYLEQRLLDRSPALEKLRAALGTEQEVASLEQLRNYRASCKTLRRIAAARCILQQRWAKVNAFLLFLSTWQHFSAKIWRRTYTAISGLTAGT